jgi:hypothetical protein
MIRADLAGRAGWAPGFRTALIRRKNMIGYLSATNEVLAGTACFPRWDVAELAGCAIIIRSALVYLGAFVIRTGHPTGALLV